MRELKFRTWDKKRKCYAKHIMTTNTSCPYHDRMNMFKGVMTFAKWVLRRYVIEQYTGLKDKNGKEIYEGDIVSEEFEYGGEKAKTIWQVRWCDDECAFELHYVSGFEVDDCWLVADDEENYKIIGNIHENPELLGEGE